MKKIVSFTASAMFAIVMSVHAADAQTVTSLLGETLEAPVPEEALVARLETRKRNYEVGPTADNLIWFARFQAYTGDYQAAIETFSKGIQIFPDDARMHRHRGHRYITVRQFDQAISDFDHAIELIHGKPNEIEPDGMPNSKNIPITTLHGNIYYHKGLAHYLKAEWPAALTAFQTCQEIGENDDNVVSSGHWIYCVLMRMGRESDADDSLSVIQADMNIVENHSYHRACLFYKGDLTAEELLENLENNPSGDSVRYAYTNWLACQGKTKLSKVELANIVSTEGWASFGHIAAEADLARLKK